MTNTKSTKRALLSSVLALFLCFAMLLGSTYAWFTDSVTSGSNVITSGTLDVDLVDAAGNSMEGKVINFVTADGRAQNDILWEPGCTYETEPVYVVNNGTLALKYQIIINGIEGDAKLLEAIEWTVTVGDKETALADLNGHLLANEKTAAIVLTGHMKETAGNEYQNLKAEGISITVFATQYTEESDSKDNQYDKDAGYNYGKTNVGPYALNVLSGGVATYDDATKTYSIPVNTVAQGGWNATQGNYYAGYTVNVAGYGEDATVSFDKPDGTTTVWTLASEEAGGFIKNGVHQQWTSVGTNRAYRYDIDGDGVTDFTVVNDASAAKVEVANAEQLKKVLVDESVSAILTADITLTEGIIVPADAVVTLDLNGHSISQTKEQTAAYSMIINRGTLIIDDSVGSGVISYTDTSDGTHYNVSNTIQNLGTLTINGGTIKNMSDVTNATNGWPQVIDTDSGSANTSVTINGGALYCANYSAIRMFCRSKTYTNTVEINGGEIYGRVDFQNPGSGKNLGKLTINGGTFDSNDAHGWSMFVFGASNTTDGTGMELSVTGGTFLKPIEANYPDWSIGAGFDYGFITGGTFSADPSDYVADGYAAVDNGDGTWTVVKGAAVSTAAELQAAIKAGGNVVLTDDITVDKWIMFSETLSVAGGNIITVEMNGLTIYGNYHTLTVNSIESAGNGNRLFYDASNLDIHDLTIKYAEGLEGGISLKSGVISNVTFDGGKYGVLPGSNGVTIEDCTFKSEFGIYYETARENVTVNGNTFNCTNYSIYLRGSETFSGNTVVTGKVNVVSGSPEVIGNNFGNERFKVYNVATATIKDNTINNLVFNDETDTKSTFSDNTLSADAQAALDAVTQN